MTMTTYLLTALGDDRPGLVAALASAVDEHGGSWVDSQLALLAGKFAGIVEVDLPAARVEAFLAALPALEASRGLRVEAPAAEAVSDSGSLASDEQLAALREKLAGN